MKTISSLHDIRLHLLFCIRNVGRVAETIIFNRYALQGPAVDLLYESLFATAGLLHVNLVGAANAKISINEKKYPVECCRGSVRKYTAYSSKTHITKTSEQSIDTSIYFDPVLDKENINYESFYAQIPVVRKKALRFTRERQWQSYDTPNNLMLALNSELAELCKIFQWKGDNKSKYTIPDKEWNKAAQEIADVFIYTLKLQNALTLQQPSVSIK